MEPIVFGMDLPALVSIPIMLGLFVFAVWFGVTTGSVGIDAEEQARRMAADERDRAA